MIIDLVFLTKKIIKFLLSQWIPNSQMLISIYEKNGIKLHTRFFVIIFCVVVFSFGNAFAHDFSTDESIDFLTVVDKIKVESKLVVDNAGKDGDQNFAKTHANNAILYYDSDTKKEISEKNERIAIELENILNKLLMEVESQKSESQIIETVDNIESILDEAVTTRIDEEQINNSTIQALVLENIIGTSLQSYGDAFNIGIDLTNMSNMNQNTTVYELLNQGPSHFIYQNKYIVNFDDYESALEFLNIALEKFYTEIFPSLSSQIEENDTKVQNYQDLENGLIDLKIAVENREQPMKVMEIVHTKIHPNLQVLFNLKLVDENDI